MNLFRSLPEFLGDMLPFFQLIFALIGGVIAVLVGQILSFYRDEISAARSFRYSITYLSELLDEDVQTEPTPERLKSTVEQLESQYVSNRWLLDEKGQQQFRELLKKTKEVIERQEDSTDSTIYESTQDSPISDILQLCGEMDHKTAHVTKYGAFKRFLGKERPYSNHNQVK